MCEAVLLLKSGCRLKHSCTDLRKQVGITKSVLNDLVALESLAIITCDSVAAVDDVDLSLQIHHKVINILSALDRLGVGIDEFASLDRELESITDFDAFLAVVHAAEDHAVDCCVGIHTDLIDLLSSEDTGFDHSLLQDICTHDGILAGHNSDLAAALLQSLLQTLGQKGSDLGSMR